MNLKPCPMCGGSASVQEIMIGHIDKGSVVRCESCLTRTRPFKLPEDAVELWNRRRSVNE